MDGRIGGPPANGCQEAAGARFDVVNPSRDRVTIDLRGIGDAVRAAAACRGMGIAQLVRRAVVISLDLRATSAVEVGSDSQTPGQAMAKLTLRLSQAHADALMLNAGALGLPTASTWRSSWTAAVCLSPSPSARPTARHCSRPTTAWPRGRPISWCSSPCFAKRRWSRQGRTGNAWSRPTPRSAATSIWPRR